ncbi:MAG: hypothetical protein ABIA93_03965, partial [Candidatus Woesearchaeota archaeon]
NPEEEVFKESGQINALDLNKVKITKEQMHETAAKYMRENHSAEIVKTMMSILQHLDKQIWNVTCVTNAFHVVNIRIDASTGEILDTSKFNVLTTGAGGLGSTSTGK